MHNQISRGPGRGIGSSVPNRQNPVGQDHRPQPATTQEELFGPWTKGVVHPKAGPALLGAAEPNSLEFEIRPDQLVQIQSPRDDISAEHSRCSITDRQVAADRVVRFFFEERNLSFVAPLKIKKTVADHTSSSETSNSRHLKDWVMTCGPSKVTEKIMGRGDVEMLEQNLTASELRLGARELFGRRGRFS